MRYLSASIVGGALVLSALSPTDAVAQGKPERSLACSRTQAPLCDVSCMTIEGKSLFVFDRVQAVFVTEFSGRHTLLEVQRASPSEIVSVLVGDISHCTLNGLRDPSLTGKKA
jgi:hypothetical protein